MIIALCGRKQHGKNTVGDILTQQYGYKQIALADPVKKIAGEIYNLTTAQLYGDCKEIIDPRWGVTPRHIMQTIGSELGRSIHPDTWIRYLIQDLQRRQDTAPGWVVTDVRYPNEAGALQLQLGAEIWRVDRSGMPDMDTHSSETSIDAIVPDCVISNNGTLEELRLQVSDIMTTRSAKHGK